MLNNRRNKVIILIPSETRSSELTYEDLKKHIILPNCAM